jgi:3-hydroxyisobutyrate dehydrogenase-like beta-hydroxyacid dehydrogenase
LVPKDAHLGLASQSVVGLLYPGELGAALGRLLTSQGACVVTTCAGRSQRTAALAQEAGLIVLDSLAEVVRESTVLFSVVTTSAAMEVAEAFCDLAPLSKASMVYVDLNSIGPETARSIAGKITGVGRSFVDGAMNGLAKNIATGGTLYLSGARAEEITRLIGPAMRVRVLGSEPGQASAMKMLLGGLSKGLCALFLELAALAERRQMLPQLQEACEMIYPGMASVVNRMLPTYAQHAGRRATEMRELERMAEQSSLTPCMIEAVRELHDRLADTAFVPVDGADVVSLVRKSLAQSLWD